MENNYYAQKLNSANLFKVYETQLPRVKQYLAAEIDFVRGELSGDENVLELGAGYGRILKEIAPYVNQIRGIDISADSVELGREYLRGIPNAAIDVLDAHKITMKNEFDIVLCLQNGLSAMKGEPEKLVRLTLEALKPGGKAYFSSYSPKFWDNRLEWFKEQSEKGLLGEIDFEKTHNGNIVCKDGFRAGTFLESDLKLLGEGVAGNSYRLAEVDESSVFLIINKR